MLAWLESGVLICGLTILGCGSRLIGVSESGEGSEGDGDASGPATSSGAETEESGNLTISDSDEDGSSEGGDRFDTFPPAFCADAPEGTSVLLLPQDVGVEYEFTQAYVGHACGWPSFHLQIYEESVFAPLELEYALTHNGEVMTGPALSITADAPDGGPGEQIVEATLFPGGPGIPFSARLDIDGIQGDFGTDEFAMWGTLASLDPGILLEGPFRTGSCDNVNQWSDQCGGCSDENQFFVPCP